MDLRPCPELWIFNFSDFESVMGRFWVNFNFCLKSESEISNISNLHQSLQPFKIHNTMVTLPQVTYPLSHELLFFTYQHRRSTNTTRLLYGQHGEKYLVQMLKGEINSRKDKENLPKEFLFDGEQEMLKQVHLLKNELREKGWSESDPPKITQPAFLRTDIGIDEPSHRFD